MSPVVAMEPKAETGRAEMTARTKARIAGLLYLLTMVGGLFGQGFIANRLITFGDAAATAAHILENENLYQLGFTVFMVELACQIVMVMLFYDLLKPVNKSLSLQAAVLGLTGCVIKIVSRLFYLAPLFILQGAKYLTVFNREQLQSMALLFLKVNDRGAALAVAFFGMAALFKGTLIIRSTFLPKVLGVLSVIGGLGLVSLLWPAVPSPVFVSVAAIALVGSLAQTVWLLAFGVNEERWREQARASAASIWR